MSQEIDWDSDTETPHRHLTVNTPTRLSLALSDAKLDVIRIETALSKFPIHRLSKKGTVSLTLQDKNEKGEVSLRWEVSHNSKYGQPGPLAYKVDTLVVNRKIYDEMRPIEKVIGLGSLSDILRTLDLQDSGQNRKAVIRALYQNAFAAIECKIRYVDWEKHLQTVEAGFTRYDVFLRGEKLPDGSDADQVYISLHDIYHDILNRSVTRPLDYYYLKALAPGPQRLYEILSPRIFAGLRKGNNEAWIDYGELCRLAPLTTYTDRKQVRKQLAKLIEPHLKEGYLQTWRVDNKFGGKFMLIVTPGERAVKEFRLAMRKSRELMP